MICNKCGIDKEIRDFTKHRYGGKRCKACCSEELKAWRKNNPEKYHDIQKRFRQNNAAKVKKWLKDWKDKNLEKSRQYQREYQKVWRKKNPGKNKEYCLNWYIKHHPNYIRSHSSLSGLTNSIKRPKELGRIDEKKERNEVIVRLANTGKHELQEIAQIFGVSHQRITEIYKKYTGRLFIKFRQELTTK